MWLKGSHLMRLHAEIKHLAIQFQWSSLSYKYVLFLIYDSDGIWYERGRALNILCVQRRTWLRRLMSRRVLVFYGRVPASHWQTLPQGINLYKSRGIRKGSCAMLVIYVFINNRKELWLGLFSVRTPYCVALSKSRLLKIGIIFWIDSQYRYIFV